MTAPMTDDDKRARNSVLQNLRAHLRVLDSPGSAYSERGRAQAAFNDFLNAEQAKCLAPSVQVRPAPGVPMGEPPRYPRVTGLNGRNYELRGGVLWGNWGLLDQPWFSHVAVSQCDVLAVAGMLRGCAP